MSKRLPSAVRAALAAPGLTACGCSGNQSALDPAGIQADRIESLYSVYFWVTVAVYAIVMGLILVALFRRTTRQPLPAEPSTTPPEDQERRKGVWVIAATAITVVALFGLLIGDFLTGRAINTLSGAETLVIQVTGHQWWWEARYEDPTPSNAFTTANEFHIPVGRAVKVVLDSTDVIHSFWVPNLHGKRDMIPGHPTHTFLRADRPGEYWGQCAEYCGLQHANMRFLVIAEPEEEFQKWLEAQRQPAPEPTTESQKHGQQVFLRQTCVTCHTINGTIAQARVGPPLTHLAGRRRIAAGTLANNRGNRGGWVMDPQSIKPGVRMPVNTLEPGDLRALLDYLEVLK